IQFAGAHTYLIYLVIVVLGFIEGPILSIICGIIIRLGYFDFTPVYISLMVGDLIGDTFLYYMGYFFGHKFVKKFGKYVGVNEENVGKVTKIFHDYQNSILWISKITSGFGFAIATLVTAGIVKIPFKTYFTINFLGQFIWSAILIAV